MKVILKDGTIFSAEHGKLQQLHEENARLKGVALPLDETTRFILGRPCFVCAPIAHRLMALGHVIERKAEDEQAYVIHWLLHLYFKHGEGWRNAAKQELAPTEAEEEAALAAHQKGVTNER